MSTPIVLPDLGVGSEPIRVSSWFVNEGEPVEAGDRILELLVAGVTFDVPAPTSGVLAEIHVAMNATVSPRDVVGTIIADDTEANDPDETESSPRVQDRRKGGAT